MRSVGWTRNIAGIRHKSRILKRKLRPDYLSRIGEDTATPWLRLQGTGGIGLGIRIDKECGRSRQNDQTVRLTRSRNLVVPKISAKLPILADAMEHTGEKQIAGRGHGLGLLAQETFIC